MSAPASASGPGFSFAGVPVRIEPFFFVVTALLGYTGAQDLQLTVIWVIVVLGSILIHEFGHAAAFKKFGISSSIVIHGMGGTTSGSGRLSTGQSVFVSLAGPFAGLALGFLVLGLNLAGVIPDTDTIAYTVGALLWVNLGWSVLNLLPILPLDGGHVVESLVVHRWKQAGQKAVYVLSILTAVGIGVFAWTQNFRFGAILAGYFAFQSFTALRKANEPSVKERVEMGLAALQQNDPASAILHLETAREANLTPEGRDLVNRSLASAYQSTGHHDRARQLLDELR